jgi:hypothetical protein
VVGWINLLQDGENLKAFVKILRNISNPEKEIVNNCDSALFSSKKLGRIIVHVGFMSINYLNISLYFVNLKRYSKHIYFLYCSTDMRTQPVAFYLQKFISEFNIEVESVPHVLHVWEVPEANLGTKNGCARKGF